MNALAGIASVVLLCAAVADACAQPHAPGSQARALQAKAAALEEDLATNAFHRPLHLQSIESADSVAGEALGLIRQPFAAAATLAQAGHWCELLTLHLNTKSCRLSVAERGTLLHLAIGKKFDQPLADAHRVDFAYTVVASTADYLQVRLDAPEGPLGTRDYRIVFEVAPGAEGQSIIRLAYSYSYGALAKLAMQAYLGTAGRNKVGFTVLGREPGGAARYIMGMRALVERNTMRYYLAIEAFLGALSTPAEARTEKRLRDWFAAVEGFPRQLREMERGEYLVMKRREYARQRAGPETAAERKPS